MVISAVAACNWQALAFRGKLKNMASAYRDMLTDNIWHLMDIKSFGGKSYFLKGVHGPFGVVFPEAVDHSIYNFLIPFPQLIVPECMLPEQQDGHNCGIIWLIVCFAFVLNQQNQKWCFEDER